MAPARYCTGASLEVAQGKVVALIGANGAGKTTTMRAISGMLKPNKGRVLLDGKPVQGQDASRIARLGLAHAPEGRKVFGPLSTEDNLLLGAYSRLPLFFGFRSQIRRTTWNGFTSLFPLLRERRHAGRRNIVRRRAADAGHRPGAHGQPQGHAAGRTLHGTCAGHRAGSLQHHPPPERGRASPCCWWNNSPKARWKWPTTPM